MKLARIGAITALVAIGATAATAGPLKLKPAKSQPEALSEGLSVDYAYPSDVKSLRDAYLDRLAARKEALKTLCKRTGWRLFIHHTDQPAEPALLWIYQALERQR